jgi:hypothetical protein
MPWTKLKPKKPTPPYEPDLDTSRGVLSQRHNGRRPFKDARYCLYYISPPPAETPSVLCDGKWDIDPTELWPPCPNRDRCAARKGTLQ